MAADKVNAEWVKANPWRWELRRGKDILGEAVSNGFNFIAYGPSRKYLGVYSTVELAQQVIGNWVERIS